ncbi:MAG: hypothetical protein JSS02_25445, partial [Planctomycetes bacterium]|nr:hypothetical protein [Planctomycetota bacterium]
TRGSLETLTIVQDHESLTLLSQLFIRRVTIFCLPGSAVATATVENKEGIYFCKQNINWKRRGLATVVGAFSRLAIRKLQDNPRVAKYLDFATWPKTLDDVHDDIFFAYVTGQREFLHRASAVYGQPAVDGVCIALRDFFAELRDATSLIA